MNGFLADRIDIKKFMSLGLLISALVNLALGFSSWFIMFAVLWGVNGWFQAIGAPSGVVSLSRWFSNRERGTYYGLWSSSHNIGEAITFIATALVASLLGWRWGFWAAGMVGILGAVMIYLFLHDSPESKGLPSISDHKNDHTGAGDGNKSVSASQLDVLKNPYIWILALSSACMYVSRYAVNSWGVFYMETHKGYSTIQASSIISVSSICGILGTVASGFLSDQLFACKRNMPALIFGVMNALAIALFMLNPPGHAWLDMLSMVLFGLAIGVLICFLGGLMAVDIASKKASGAALGVVGIASYLGAGIQDIASGYLIENYKAVDAEGLARYDFTPVSVFWIGMAVLSFLLATMVWNAKVKN